MILQQLVPQRPGVEVTNESLRAWISQQDWPAPSLLLNLVASPDGSFAGINGSSLDISNDVDRQVLLGIRDRADGILTTAKTARVEGYSRSRLAPLALVSRSGDFTGIPAVESAESGSADSLVYLLVAKNLVQQTKAAYDLPWVRVVGYKPKSVLSLKLTLTGLGWRRIVVESGLEYSKWLIREFAISQLSLVIVGSSPEIGLESTNAALLGLGVVGGTLEGASRVDGTLMTRWSNLYAPQANKRRGNLFGSLRRIA